MIREKIEAGTKKIGDEWCGKIITGLGKIWYEKVTDEDACCYGLRPGMDYYSPIKVQYAYFN